VEWNLRREAEIRSQDEIERRKWGGTSSQAFPREETLRFLVETLLKYSTTSS